MKRKKKAVKAVIGWVELDYKDRPLMGTIGLKVYRYKKDILAEGIPDDCIVKVSITPLK